MNMLICGPPAMQEGLLRFCCHAVSMYVLRLLVNQKGAPLLEGNDQFFIKLGMWVVLGTSVTQVVCCHQKH